MYDIVNNIESGLDVDKLDYFLRDTHYAGIIGTHAYFFMYLYPAWIYFRPRM